MAAGQAGAVLRTIAVLQAYKADLLILRDLDQRIYEVNALQVLENPYFGLSFSLHLEG